jgi:hypothetical protein
MTAHIIRATFTSSPQLDPHHGRTPEREELDMNKRILAGIAAGLLTVAVLLAVGVGAYRAGERSDTTVEVVGEVVTGTEGATRTVLVPTGATGWHGGWHGPGFGFVLFPLLVIGVVLLFASRRGGWRGPGPCDEDLREWHRRQHGDQPAAPTG